MLQLQLQTSSSELITITDFQYIYDLAKCSKCQIFTLLKETNKLYGGTDDCCCIHEIDVPFLVNTDLAFYMDPDVKDIVSKYDSFFIPDMFNWVILPSYYWEIYKAGDLISQYDYSINQYLIIDKSIMQPIEQIQMFKVRPVDDYQRMTFNNQISGYLNRVRYLLPPITFTGMENYPTIREAFDNKVSMGRVLIRLNNGNSNIGMYFYKSLFALAKNDTLDIDIRFDRFKSEEFVATFKPKKKKNPLTFNTYGVPFQERIHCMFVNVL